MKLNMTKEVATLERLGVADLRRRYAEVFGEPTRVGNKAWLIKRIAWRMQALAEGDLTERARRRAAELANDADLRLNPPKAPVATASDRTTTLPFAGTSDTRLPLPGTILTRVYKGRTLQVRVLAEGFEFEGAVYRSLSGVARAITGTHCNGYLYFRLTQENQR